ncbi:MAG: hypothetical protein KGI54_18140, partial [Pseudomonadota bacterium]|nr:hypothetical protein [Pseudomonadota bacterium]
MAKEKTDVVITKELQDTVRLHDGKGNGKHRLIKNVYFDENGNHYFNKYTVKLHEVDDSGNVTKVKDVECLGSTETIVHIIQKGVGGKVTGVKDMKAV